MSSYISTDAAICNLQKAIRVYEDIKYPNLIEMLEYFRFDDLYAAVFKWVDGECLFEHWNFEKYANNKSMIPPRNRFCQLTFQKKTESI